MKLKKLNPMEQQENVTTEQPEQMAEIPDTNEAPDPETCMKQVPKPAASEKGTHRKPTSEELRKFVTVALFVGLIILLGLTPLGLIPLGFINVTILCVPVIAGTLLLGLKSGMILGAAFGGVSFASALMKPSALVSTLMGVSPILVFILSMVPRLCVPLVAWMVNKWLNKQSENLNVSYLTAALCGGIFNILAFLLLPGWLKNAGCSEAVASTLTAIIGLIVNTGIGFGMFRLLNMKNRAIAAAAVCGSLTNTVLYLGLMLLFYCICGINSEKVLSLIGGTALLAGSMEAVAASVLCTPIVLALNRFK